MTLPDLIGTVTAIRASVDPTTGSATVQLAATESDAELLLELDNEARQHLAAALGGPAVPALAHA